MFAPTEDFYQGIIQVVVVQLLEHFDCFFFIHGFVKVLWFAPPRAHQRIWFWGLRFV